MKGLSKDIEQALDTILDGLDHRFKVDELDADELKAAMKSKLSSFKSAKEILHKWENSPSAPGDAKLRNYVGRLVKSGDASLAMMRRALKAKIKYRRLQETRHYLAIEAKVFLLDAIVDLEAGIMELRFQLESGKINLKDNEFKRGFAEKYADGEFYPLSDYYKRPYNEKEDAIVIDPKGSRGPIIELDGLRVQLPHPPKNKKLIRYHGKKHKEQYWRREPLPKGCTAGNSAAFYEYIMEQFRLRREGLWFYNNGKPTWITGRHWYQLQWGKMLADGIYPDYREAQRDIAYHKQAVWLDNRCVGQAFLKSRQTGYTYQEISDSLEEATSTPNAHFGLTSMTETDAKKAFAKESYQFLNLPFFFQPIVKGRLDSLSGITFGRPADTSKRSKQEKDTSTEGYLNTTTDYQATKEKAYDGQTLKRLSGDECAKWGKISWVEHVKTVMPVLYRGGRVRGKFFAGSTMGKLDDGGEDFKTIYLNSNPLKREDSGFTTSKFYKYFMPAHKNFEACIDKHGKCWEETPPKGTLNIFGEPILKGSVEMILDMYKEAKKLGDAALNAVYRNFPMTESHALRDDASGCVFNLEKITDQYDYNDSQQIEDTRCSRGNFEWVLGQPFTEVEWHPDPRGRFNIFWMPSPADMTQSLQNNVKTQYGKYYPVEDYACIGVDSFGSYVVGKNKHSKGAAHAFSAPHSQWAPPDTFLFEYLERPPTQDIFNEDIIKAAWFYGIPILPENNQKDFVKWCYLNNCRNFILNRLDRISKPLAGDDLTLGGQPMTGKDVLAQHENAIRSYVQTHVGHKTKEIDRGASVPMGTMGEMPFNRTLHSWMRFNPAKRTEFDATISSGLSIMGARRAQYKRPEKKQDPKKMVSLVRKYSNRGDIGEFIKPKY